MHADPPPPTTIYADGDEGDFIHDATKLRLQHVAIHVPS